MHFGNQFGGESRSRTHKVKKIKVKAKVNLIRWSRFR